MNRRIFAMIIVLTIVMGTLTGCRNTDFDSKTIDEAATYANSDEVEVITEDRAAVEDEAVIEDKTVVEDEVVEDEIAEDKVVEEKSESTKTESTNTAPAETKRPAQSTTPAQTNSSAQSTTPVQPTTPAQSASAHEHTWIAHNVTTQVWVPNIVVVDDYEYQIVGKTDTVFHCNMCNFETTDRDAIAQHAYDTHHGFAIREGHDIIEEVKVGSHEEDHGHYETSTYVDYYYCECGATKN